MNVNSGWRMVRERDACENQPSPALIQEMVPPWNCQPNRPLPCHSPHWTSPPHPQSLLQIIRGGG